MVFPILLSEAEPNDITAPGSLRSLPMNSPTQLQHSRSVGSSTSRNTRLKGISEDDGSSQMIADAPYAEEPESLYPNPSSPSSAHRHRTPLPSPTHPDQENRLPANFNARSPTGRRSLTQRSRAFTTGNLSPPNERPHLTRGPIHTPTLLMAIRVANTSATTAVNVEYEDTQALFDIWPIYAEEAALADHKMLTGWHRSLDVRLLFSGLFSAILTPFIVESYKMLQIQGPAPAFFGENGYRVRINAMWFGSLIMSLIAALLSIHYKQWLDGYVVDLGFQEPEALQQACRLRQFRYQGLQKYYIHQAIGLLPVLLYLALLFFAVGLIDFLWHLNMGIAIYISFLCGMVAIVHIFTTVVPFFTTRTPFKTPLSNVLGNLWRGMREGKFAAKGMMDDEEAEEVAKDGKDLDARCLDWLMRTTRIVEVHELALRAHKELDRQRRYTSPC